MVTFISFLRAFAACLITNAHYEGIYPSDIMANGGLIGDIIFFAVSGYCLCNIKQSLNIKGFLYWYGKRLWRVYPPVIMCTAIYVLFGAYSISGKGFFWWFIYPTYYHFIASIVILYIPYFFIIKIKLLHDNLGKVMIGIAFAWLLCYFLFYDRSYYHIDSVYEFMIRFLFMESMLLGAWFRINDEKFRNKRKRLFPIGTLILFILYFGSKLVFSRYNQLSSFQFLNQIIIFALLFFVFRSICGVDQRLEKMPGRIKQGVEFISRITLEIYVVQYVLIGVIRNLGLVFPLNWLLLTASIFFSAFLLHKWVEVINKGVIAAIRRLKRT